MNLYGKVVFRAMTGVLVLYVSSIFLHAAGEPIGVDPTTIQISQGVGRRKAIQINSDGGLVDVELHAVRLNLSSPGGKNGLVEAIIIFEPKSGRTWWKYERGDPKHNRDAIQEFLSSYKIFMTADTLVGFTLSGHSISIRECKEREGSIADVLTNVITWLQKDLKRSEWSWDSEPKNVSLG